MAYELHKAAAGGQVEAVKSLLEKGADVNVADLDGRTPLHWAAWYGYAEVVTALLEKGAEVNAGDVEERTPLHWAAWDGNTEAVKALLEQGGDQRIQDRDGKSAEDLARARGHHAVAEILHKAASKTEGKGR